MKSLTDIVPESKIERLEGSLDRKIRSIQLDSRKVKKSDCFVALKGSNADGHAFIGQAVRQGAKCIVCQELPNEIDSTVTYIQCGNTVDVLAEMAANFYGNPSAELSLIGITGTNGKTTTATLIYDMLEAMGYKCGLISTVENKIHRKVERADLTTPDVLKINALLSEMVDGGCAYAVMEVSSHAVDQGRIKGLQFDVAVFTNLSHDHLDYHGDFKKYRDTKKKFFDNLSSDAFALVNRDDKNGEVMVQNTIAKVNTYAIRRMADYKLKVLDNTLEGLHLRLDGLEIYSSLVGRFNAYNLLAAYATAKTIGLHEIEVLQALSQMSPATGRFETIREGNSKVTGIVDFAHTPDALNNVLETLLQVKNPGSQLITVVGAGGDRDQSKRPVMARIAVEMSDQLILTSDNPRSEDPMEIINQMESGIPENLRHKLIIQADRMQAIKTAVTLAREGDIVLVAGKGHETYQEINGTKHPFDDRKIIRKCLRKEI